LGKQVFVYMPTFRDDNRPAYPYSWEALDEVAGRKGIRILARLHPVDTAIPSKQQSNRFINIRLHDQTSDLYQLFGKVDCLITDYSSVVYDFMLLRKPIIFFCPDLNDFLRNSRSFCFDYQDVTPAPKVKTLAELESIIKKIVDNDSELARWHEQYEQVLKRFHFFQDSQSSARCHKAILERLV
ncbi:MAG: CDP-glycerol glycerophosphotransferase family protein, partial [Pseudomonadales bacterium]